MLESRQHAFVIINREPFVLKACEISWLFGFKKFAIAQCEPSSKNSKFSAIAKKFAMGKLLR